MKDSRQVHVVRTPENVTFELELAGLASRALAWGIDVGVMGALIMLAAKVLEPLMMVTGGFANALLMIVVFLVQWWYAALLEWVWAGRTVGKRLVGLRTLSDDGLRMGFLASVIRNLVRIVDLLPGLYFVGGLSSLIDGRNRRLGDLAAGTIVVRERKAPLPSAVVPSSERYNSFLEDPSVGVAIKQITAPERDVMIHLSLRREQLPLPVRRALFARLAAHLEQRLGIPRPAFFSEEKYVLNLTALALAR